MKKILLLAVLFLFLGALKAQNISVSGTISDELSGETLIGANVVYATGKGVVTDIEGNFEIKLMPGNYTLKISYIGYDNQQIKITVDKKPIVLNIQMEITTLNEVEVIADIAEHRKSPVAFSSISQKMIEEEGGAQDLPLILNTTPSVYATQQGGGTGDAEIIIRGFDQRNLGVMVDGIPVNDMENGRVFWSNWNLPVSNMQVQRGLSISKLALPSVGGTINVITPSVDNEKGLKIKQQFGSGAFLKTDIAYNSGKFKNGWGFSIAGSYWQGDGIVDRTFSEGGSYFVKVEKMFLRNRLSFTAFGAPQKHGQRSFKNPMSIYDKDYAAEIGISQSKIDSTPEYGLNYNEHWGVYEDYQFIGIGTPHPITGALAFKKWELTQHGKTIIQNERINFFHKPMFNLRDFWNINEKSYLVSTFYASFGRGGGTGLNSRGNANFDNGINPTDSTQFIGTNGQLNFQNIYNLNRQDENNPEFNFLNIDPNISSTDIKGSNYIRANMNNHNWYGFLSQYTNNISNLFNFSVGIDLRTYKGSHFGEVYNLIGADYVLDVSDDNAGGPQVKKVGDKVRFYNDSFVRWIGGYGQVQYTGEKVIAFINVTLANTWYKRIDYFKKQTIEGTNEETDWVTFIGYTVKGGANYNITDNHSIYGNIGYLNNPPKFNTVINFNNEVGENTENETIFSTELGYAYHSHKFTGQINGYYTLWNNKQINRNISATTPDDAVNGDPDSPSNVFIPFLDALHKGIELDLTYKITPKWQLTGVGSAGDWTWQSKEKADYRQNGELLVDADGNVLQFEFDASGVHVGAAPQLQLGGALQFKPNKDSYIRLRYIYYGKYFSEFNPESLTGGNQKRESWQVPNYSLFSLFLGYNFKLDFGILRAGFNVYNLLNTVYIANALNNETRSRYINTANFDAASAGVFPGYERRFSFTLALDILGKSKTIISSPRPK